MQRILLFLFIPLFLFGASGLIDREGDEEGIPLSLPEEIEDPLANDSDLIGGILSPLNGLPCIQELDLIARGAENVILTRRYLATQTPNRYSTDPGWEDYFRCKFLFKHIRGWTFFPHTRFRVVNKKSGRIHRFTHPSGTTIDFQLTKGNTELTSKPYGISNYSGGLPSGRYDARNTKIQWEKGSSEVVVRASDGTKYIYQKENGNYLLHKEVRLNGKVWRYIYSTQGNLQRVESLDPQEMLVYASIDVEGSPADSLCTFSTHSNQTASYHYLVQKLEATGKTKKKGAKYEESISCNSRPILTSVNSPFHQNESIEYNPSFLLQNYVSHQNPFKCSHKLVKKKGDSPYFHKANKLQMPVGKNNEWHDLHEITYDPPVEGEKTGSTTVTNSDGTQDIYEFTKNLLLKSKKKYDAAGNLRKEKNFEWNVDNTLASIEWRNGNQYSLLKKSYIYDRFGNPTLETLEGDLTGNGEKDTYTISRTFSEDGFHLILTEEKEGGSKIEYTYLPETNLVLSEFIKDRDQIILRKFLSYDQWNNLVQEISDNGCSTDAKNLIGVTERTIVNYRLRQESPHLHMPEWIEEKYLDGGQEKLLRKTHLTYDVNSQVIQEDVYDSGSNYSYSIHKAYNDRGKLKEETNAIGQKASYTYDERGNLTESIPFSHQLHKKMKYDLKGRLLEEQEIGTDGTVRNFFYQYDPQGRRIYQQDHLNHVTEYRYDLITDKASDIDYPRVLLDAGVEMAISTKSTFDPWGREIEKWDANGNTTRYSYNTYGKVIEIIHPDGSNEKFSYTKNGRLSSSIDSEGNRISYKRDCLDRVTSKEVKSADGKLLATERFEYDAYHLKKWIDKEGNATCYFYDGAGRRIRKVSSGKTIEYHYDALGRLDSKCLLNGENTLKITYTRDLLDRITEEKKSDLSDNIYSQVFFDYDTAGNISKETRFVNGQESCTSYVYDSFDRLILKQTPLGRLTHIRYDESTLNALGQKVLKKITTDERNIITIETFDPFGKVVKKEKLNGSIWLSCQTKQYDPCENLIEQKDYSSEGEAHLLKYIYSPRNQMTDFIRAFGSSNERKTSYTYTPSRKIQSKTLPNGVTIYFYYNPLGQLEKRISSDKTIDHTFKYDLNGHLLKCKDSLNGIEVTRTVDPFGNILSETLSKGLHLEKTYDYLDRPFSIKIPHAGTIHYHYNPCHLTKIERNDNEGNYLYAHTFDAYDLNGNVLEEHLLGGIGKGLYTYDLEEKITSINHPFFHENYSYSLEGNLIERKEESSYQYSYDLLDQLTSENLDTYTYDALYTRTAVNGQNTLFNELRELLQQNETKLSYDLNGNLIQKDDASFSFDSLNQLIHAKINGKTIAYLYDPLGRCLRKTSGVEVENYLYDGQQEIGAFNSDFTPKQLRILESRKHFPKTVAIELDSKPFAPLTDAQGNIRLLIDPETKTITEKYNFTAFGESLHSFKSVNFNPWQFASKRLDPDLQWIQFGKRHYDPLLARWTTTDPAGFTDSVNLYQFLFNNPYRYRDPDGRIAFAIPLLTWGGAAGLSWLIPTWSTVVAIALGTGAGVAYYELTKDENGAAAIADGIAGVGTDQEEKKKKKYPPTYFPDRPLPQTEHGVHIPDTDAPHTQLGTEEGRKGPYPQAREFDKDGQPIRDGDFTDHGRPHNHPNPHQHKWNENQTGGTKSRSKDAEPLEGWEY